MGEGVVFFEGEVEGGIVVSEVVGFIVGLCR